MLRKVLPIKLRNLIRTYLPTKEPHYVKWFSQYLGLLGGKQSFFERLPLTSTGEALPWMTYPAIEFFSQIDTARLFIFEYGSGKGSIYWAKRARRVLSVEDDPLWIEKLRPFCRDNHKIVFAAGRDQYVYSVSELDERPDVVIIDGKYRRKCAGVAVSAVSPSGMIILDNSDWFPGTCEFLAEKGFSQIDFIGPGPINAYAWATSIFIKMSDSVLTRRLCSAPRVIGGLGELGDET